MVFFKDTSAGGRLLAHNLFSAIEIGEKILQLALDAPEMKQGPVAAEASLYQGDYRSLEDERARHEILFLSQISRCEHWFSLLRRMEPRLKREIRAFTKHTKNADEVLEQLQASHPHLLAKKLLPDDIGTTDTNDAAPTVHDLTDLENVAMKLRGTHLIGDRIDVAELVATFRVLLNLLEQRHGLDVRQRAKNVG